MRKKKTAPKSAAPSSKRRGDPILSMRVDETFIAKIDKWAARKGLSRSAAIRELIARGLKP